MNVCECNSTNRLVKKELKIDSTEASSSQVMDDHRILPVLLPVQEENPLENIFHHLQLTNHLKDFVYNKSGKVKRNVTSDGFQ